MNVYCPDVIEYLGSIPWRKEKIDERLDKRQVGRGSLLFLMLSNNCSNPYGTWVAPTNTFVNYEGVNTYEFEGHCVEYKYVATYHRDDKHDYDHPDNNDYYEVHAVYTRSC